MAFNSYVGFKSRFAVCQYEERQKLDKKLARWHMYMRRCQDRDCMGENPKETYRKRTSAYLAKRRQTMQAFGSAVAFCMGEYTFDSGHRFFSKSA